MAKYQGGMLRTFCAGVVAAAIGFLNGISHAGPMDMEGQFSVSPMGAATYTIPILVPPGIAGIEPQLAFNYSSQAGGDGKLGVGWGLSGFSSITRCPATKAQDNIKGTINFDNNDRFCMDGQRLILVSGAYGADGAVYRTELDNFSVITSYGTAGNGPAWFKVQTKAGQIIEYGNTDDSRIEASKAQTSWAGHGNFLATWPIGTVRAWAINKVSDVKGNYLTYTYEGNLNVSSFYDYNVDYLPRRIDYTGNTNTAVAPNASVQFVYDAPYPNIFPAYLAGSVVAAQQPHLLKIQTYVGSTLVKEYRMTYTAGTTTGRSHLATLSECPSAGTSNTCKPAFAPTWTELNSSTFNTAVHGSDLEASFLADVNGDGRADVVNQGYDGLYVALATDGGFGSSSLWVGSFGKSQGYSNQYVTPIFVLDLNGDGMADVVGFAADGVYVAYSTGSGFGAASRKLQWFGSSNAAMWANMDVAPRTLADVNGDGRPDIVGFGQLGFFVALNTGDGFALQNVGAYDYYYFGSIYSEPLVDRNGVSHTLTFPSNSTHPRLVQDVNGDGLADVVAFTSNGVYVSLSTGSGFATPVQWTWSYGTGSGWVNQNIHPRMLADVNGDGLPDIVGFGEYALSVGLNTGTYFEVGGVLPGSFSHFDGYTSQADFPRYMADVNGDGKADIVAFAPGGGVQVALSNGTSTQWLAQSDIHAGYYGYANHLRQLADVDGDGFVDIVSGSIFGTSVAYSGRTVPPDIISSFPSGLGLAITVGYGSLTRPEVYTKGSGAVYPLLDLSSPMYVVSNVKTPNALGGNYTSNYYQYGGLRADLSGRGMLGFGWQQMQQVENNITQRTDYRQDWPYIGMPSYTARMLPGAGNGGLLSVSVNSYDCYSYLSSNPLTGAPCNVNAGNRYFAYQSQSVAANWDLGGDPLPVTTTANAFDSFGNATQIAVTTDDGYTKTTTNTYGPNDAGRALGRLIRSKVVSTVPDSGSGTSGNTNLQVRVFTKTLAADQANYNLRADAITAGWNQTDPLDATVTIGSGVIISSASTAQPAFATGTGFPAGSRIKLINNGYIVGAGGNGGAGGIADESRVANPGSPGLPGGDALFIGVDTTIDNTNGSIFGGGGGGTGEPSGTDGSTDGVAGGGGQGQVGGVGGVNGSISGPGPGGGAWGEVGGGTAGRAIVTYGNSITWLGGNNSAQMKGAVITGNSSAQLTITAVTPSSGGIAGGTSITITGSGFVVGGTAVSIGGVTANCSVSSSTSMTCTTPPNTAGTKNVVVSAGGSTASLAGFTYQGVTLTAISPTQGSTRGDLPITLTGSGFVAGSTVTIGGVTATNCTVASSTSMTCNTPANTSGVKDVVLGMNGNTVKLANAFTYQGPTLTAVSPTQGSAAGGTPIALTGSNFVMDYTTVSIGGVAAINCTVTSSTSMTCTLPANAAGVKSVAVTVGGASATLVNSYTYQGTLTAVAPNTGSVDGGTPITLTGTGFADGAIVTLGGIAATNCNVTGSTSITCTTPANTAGVKNVAINVAGSSMTLANSYTYQPTLTAVTPNTGSYGGGTSVTLTGSGFATGTTVTIGGVAATGCTVTNSTSMTCTTPANTAGAKDVVVSVSGTSATLANGFTYQGMGIWPNMGSFAGGTPITLSGAGFVTGASVTIGGTAATGCTVVNASTITCTTPAGTAGAQDVVVTNGGTPTTITGGFTYQALALTSVSPNVGWTGGGTSITLTGSGFATGATVTVGGTTATNCTVASPTAMSCITPAGTEGAKNVVVSLAGTSTTLNGGFTYKAPTVTAITPATGGVGGGTSVTLTGTNFEAGATVTIGGTAATNCTVASATSMTCTTPAGMAGARDVVVTIAGNSATLASGYIYQAQILAAISPTSGGVGGGTAITLSGSNFAAGATVTIGGTAATNCNVASSTVMTCTTPAGTLGVKDVVMTVAGNSTTLTGAYTYFGPALTAVTPNQGDLAGGTAITLSGTNFAQGAAVTIGGTAANCSFVNSTSMTCTTAANSAGAKDVVVTVTGNTATLAGGFTYQAPPFVFSPVISSTKANYNLRAEAVAAGWDQVKRLNATVTVNSGAVVGSTSTTTYAFDTGTNFPAGSTLKLVNHGYVAGAGGSGGWGCTGSGASPGAAGGPAIRAQYPIAIQNDGVIGGGGGGGGGGGSGDSGLAGGGDGGGGAGQSAGIGGSASATLTTGGQSFSWTGSSGGDTGGVGGWGGDLGQPGQNGSDGDGNGSGQWTPGAPGGAAGAAVAGGGYVSWQSGNDATHLKGAQQGPMLTSVSPTQGSATGGTSINIYGSGFVAGATSVSIGGVSATNCNVASSTSMTCATSANTMGTKDIVVTASGASALLANAYTYQGTLTAVAPNTGSAAGGTTITLTGTGFAAGATVTVGGAAATNCTVTNSTAMTCTTPANTAGAKNVVVTVSGTGMTLANGYTYYAPTLTAVAPSTGGVGGGTVITLTGSNFAAGASVSVGGVAATNCNVASSTSMTCTTPANIAGTTSIDVTVAGASATLAGSFTYGGPTLTAVTPSAGLIGGGTVITLTGSNFATGATAIVGGIAATNCTVASATSMTCTTPANTAGAKSIVVTVAGTGATLANGYTYQEPTLTAVTPTAGVIAGGTVITLTGSNFAAGAIATIGGVAATGCTVTNATSMTCTTPANTVGAKNVVVNVSGTSATLANGFTYQDLSISPTVGALAGGTPITLSGSGFVTGATVMIGGAAATGCTVVNASTLTCTTPAGTAGSQDVVVTNGGTPITIPGAFTYEALALSSVSPNIGWAGGGTSIALTGSGFATGATATVGGVAAINCTVINTTSMTCTTPAGTAGAKNVVVTVSGTSVTLSGGFTYKAPTVTAITPATGGVGGGTSVTLTGSNFETGATVMIGGTAATNCTVTNATTMTCTTPAGMAGARDVVVTVAGNSATLTGGYTYQAPTLTAISPASGGVGGGTTITLTGSSFAAGATVTIGSAAATNCFVASATTMSCTTPAGMAGPRNVVVTVAGNSVTLTGGYTYLAPTLTAVTPNQGDPAGGTAITLTGTNFSQGATVMIGNVAATNCNVVSATSMTCTTPANIGGAKDVVVTVGGNNGTLVGGFTYMVNLNLVISGNVANYNLRAAAVAAGWDQITKLSATITVNASAVVGSATTAGYAFDTGTNFPAGSTLKLVNHGYVVGAGGNGGNNSPGATGGPAIRAQYPITIQNDGVIGGGGGGGGAYGGYGGGGGAGSSYGTGAPNWSANGGLTLGGAGGTTGEYYSSGMLCFDTAGSGGDLGVAGGTGISQYEDSSAVGFAGGAAGAAVIGSSYVSWQSGNDATHLKGAQQ